MTHRITLGCPLMTAKSHGQLIALEKKPQNKIKQQHTTIMLLRQCAIEYGRSIKHPARDDFPSHPAGD